MNPFQDKYSHINGTHCWFCDREYATSRHIYVGCGRPLLRTREHIIPKSKIIYNYPKNYIGSCGDCNSLKGTHDARRFAEKIIFLTKKLKKGEHNMYHLFPIMKQRAWKLYNKTSYLHRNYKELRLTLVQDQC